MPGTGHVAKRANYVDDYVNTFAAIMFSLAGRGERAAGPGAEAQALEVEAAALRTRLTEAALMAGHGTITMAQLATMTGDMQGRLSTAESRLADLALTQSLPTATVAPSPDDVTEEDMAAWLALPIDDRRDFVRRALNVILLSHYKGSARVFDRDTVMVVFKNQSSARGLMPAAELASLKEHWLAQGILPASGLRTFNHPSPIDGRKKKVPTP